MKTYIVLLFYGFMAVALMRCFFEDNPPPALRGLLFGFAAFHVWIGLRTWLLKLWPK